MITITKQNLNENMEYAHNEKLYEIASYFSNEKILNLLKLAINETNYLIFLKNIDRSNIFNNISMEEHVKQNLTVQDLLSLIKEYDETTYNSLIQEMINLIY